MLVSCRLLVSWHIITPAWGIDMKQLTIHEHVARNFASRTDAFLTLALLVVAAVLVCVAFMPDHKFLKAGALAWVVLP